MLNNKLNFYLIDDILKIILDFSSINIKFINKNNILYFNKFNFHCDRCKLIDNNINHYKFKDEYYVIGNTFYKGKYLGKDIDNNWKIGIAKVNMKKELDDGIYIVNDVGNIIIYDGEVTFSSNNPKKT